MREGELNPDLCLSQVHPNQVQAFPSRELVMEQQGGVQVNGNIGIYYAAYRLSQQGWNVMPTARNARALAPAQTPVLGNLSRVILRTHDRGGSLRQAKSLIGFLQGVSSPTSNPLVSAPMETTDFLEMLTQLQGEIKRCRELAERTTDDRFALLLYRIADEVEQQAREADRL